MVWNLGLIYYSPKNNTAEQASQNSPTTQNQTDVALNPNKKIYTALTYPSYAPYQYLDEQGKIIGFDVDMINAIAKSQNIQVQIVNSPWVGMLE